MIGAFIIGLFGSFHCVGMCGPVMIAFMGSDRSKIGFVVYHAGRILTYVLLGAILGFIGATVNLFDLQKVLVFILGFSLLILYGTPSIRHALERKYYQSSFYQLLKSFLAKNLSSRKRWFLSGVANGFFPCGLTYVAAAGAVALGNPFESSAFMILFGLGTIPSLMLVSFAGNTFFQKFKNSIPRSVTIIAILSGSILILRGLLMTFPDFNQMVQANAMALVTICGL